MNTSVSSSLIYSGLPFTSMPGLAPAGDLLFFASPKKPKEKKGDPQSGPLCGSLKKPKEPENLETSLLRSRRTSRFFIRLLQLFQAQPGRVGDEIRNRIRGCPLPEGREEVRIRSRIFLAPRSGWGEERRAKWIRASACLSEASLRLTPL